MFSRLAYLIGFLLFAAAIVGQRVVAKETHVVRFYNWTDYIDLSVLDEFSKETGIRVEYSTFESSEELESKILSKHSGYDLVVTSATFLARQRTKGLFQPIQKSQLSQYSMIDPNFLKKWQSSDPENKYGVPYLWGTTVFAYNKKLLLPLVGKDAPWASWKLLMDPVWSKKSAPCGIAWLDSPSEVMPEVLRAVGTIVNSQNPMDYHAAERLFEQLRPNIRYFGGAEIIDDLGKGNICLAFSYSGDLSQARSLARENGEEITVVNPIEGAQMWTGLMAIPIDSTATVNTHKLIDYLLRPRNMARISNKVAYANPVATSWHLVDENIRNDSVLFPSVEEQKRLYTQYLLTDAIEKIQQRVWQTVRPH